MADNSIPKSFKKSEKSNYNNIVHRTTSESLRLNDTEKAAAQSTALPTAHNPRKISSFEITSVTVGSRVSTDAGDDSADDLDESHTDDISRVTDFGNDTPSFSEDTYSKDELFYNASSNSLGCAPVIPTSSQYGLAIVGQDGGNQHGCTVPNNNEVNDMHVSVTNSSTGSIINIIGNSKPQEGMKEIQEHVRNERFKVVKIESTEPFRRGRWMCMDYLDHTSQPNTNIIVNNLDGSEGNNLQAPDSGVVISDSQLDDNIPNSVDLNKQATQVGASLQCEQNMQKVFPMASPGQSLTQPLKQQPMSTNQSIPVQSPPLELPQQITQNMQSNPQQHPQSMTHITVPNQTSSHPQNAQSQNVQQMPQSFPQHQLPQVLGSQGIQQMHSMHQQMQQMPNQAQLQQMTTQHLSQAQPQISNIGTIPQQLGGMQQMTTQNQMQQVSNQQSQIQQLQMQQMQGQSNQAQMHQIQNINQQPQLQMQSMTSQQIPNHLQQMQMNATQQMPQMHQLTGQQTSGQQQVVSGMHSQMPPNSMSVAYNQSVNQQSNTQSMMNTGIPSSQQTMVSASHNVPYHTQQSQMSQQGQTLPQDVLSTIASSQSASVAANLQSLPSQPPGSTLPSNLQALTNQQQQNTIHQMPQQPQSMPQGAIQIMNQNPQSLSMSMESNQQNIQMPVSETTMYMQANQQIPMSQHLQQAQGMLQQVNTTGQSQIGMQYVLPQQANMQAQQNVPNQTVPQSSMQQAAMTQQIPIQSVNQQQPMMQNMVQHQMPMHQNMPVSMQGHSVTSSGVQSQTNVQANIQSQVSMQMGNYNSQQGVANMQQNIMPVISQTNINNPAQIQGQSLDQSNVCNSSVANSQAIMSGTNSPVISGYQSGQSVDGQSFTSPVSVAHNVNNMVNNSAGVNSNDIVTQESSGQGSDVIPAADTGDGKDDIQSQAPNEDESFTGLAMALGGNSGAGSPATTVAANNGDGTDQQTSRAPSPGPTGERAAHHSSASGTSAVAIDNKIEQAMDLVKSHLMFAVREEVEVLKERIAELMERITQLELENSYLRAHASQDTLAQLPVAQPKAAPQQSATGLTGLPGPVS